MPKKVPAYRAHASGQARVRINGKDRYLGKFGSPESHREYARVIDEWRQSQDRAIEAVTVGQLTSMYIERCKRHYVKADEQTSEVSCVRIACRHVNQLYRNSPAADFTPRMLKAVRDRMVQVGYVRTSINRNVGRIRRMFKWAVSEELVPLNTYLALGSLQGLQQGRSDAIEAEPVNPVPQAFIDAVESRVRSRS